MSAPYPTEGMVQLNENRGTVMQGCSRVLKRTSRFPSSTAQAVPVPPQFAAVSQRDGLAFLSGQKDHNI
jgi:hypothetical protein